MIGSRPELGTPKVGDTVIVIPYALNNRHHPKPIEATITKVARLFVTMTENANNRDLTEGQFFHAREWRMRMATQCQDSQYSHTDKFVTPEQHAWDLRDKAAREYLEEVGVSIDRRSPNYLDVNFRFTLANLLRAHYGLDPF